MTRELIHSGVAAPLTLKSALTVPASGGFNLVVWGDASGSGWPSIPVGAAIVVTVGRGTQQEAKYLVSGVTSTATESTLAVPDWGRGYDGTTPTDLPMGTLIEHTISAVEMAELNDISSRTPDSVSGELVFTETAQLLTNKTFPTPTAASHPATKAYVEAGFVPRLTQAQIDALSGDSRPIGFTVSNATTGQFQKWDGTKWVDYVDSSGSFTGDLSLVQNGAGDKGVRFLDGAVRRWYIAFEQATKRLNVHRYNSSGTYQGAPIIIEENGRVISGSHIAGVWAGTTGVGLSAGLATFALPQSPTGRWSLVPSGGGGGTVWSGAKTVSTTDTSATVFVYSLATGDGLEGVAATVHWHAIAY